jgi:hypothetical protein
VFLHLDSEILRKEVTSIGLYFELFFLSLNVRLLESLVLLFIRIFEVSYLFQELFIEAVLPVSKPAVSLILLLKDL